METSGAAELEIVPAGRAAPESDFLLTQGLRPGLYYAAPPGLGFGYSFCWCRPLERRRFPHNEHLENASPRLMWHTQAWGPSLRGRFAS